MRNWMRHRKKRLRLMRRGSCLDQQRLEGRFCTSVLLRWQWLIGCIIHPWRSSWGCLIMLLTSPLRRNLLRKESLILGQNLLWESTDTSVVDYSKEIRQHSKLWCVQRFLLRMGNWHQQMLACSWKLVLVSMTEIRSSFGCLTKPGSTSRHSLSTSLQMTTLASSKSSQIEFREMIKSGEDGSKKMNLRMLQFQIMKRKLVLMLILDLSFIYVLLGQWEKIEQCLQAICLLKMYSMKTTSNQ